MGDVLPFKTPGPSARDLSYVQLAYAHDKDEFLARATPYELRLEALMADDMAADPKHAAQRNEWQTYAASMRALADLREAEWAKSF